MLAYRKERIDNIVLYFASEHYKKTKKYLSQTALYKYLAFFEFRHLKKHGDMPLELHYRAMQYGPVPIDIYEHREDINYFPKVLFEKKTLESGKAIFIVKPIGKFEDDYFSENELEDMRELIEIFAQQWVGAQVMSDGSHQSLRSWKVTYKRAPNTLIDPKDEFDSDILSLPPEALTAVQERYLLQRLSRQNNA
jgi:hypothetical protein